MQQEEMQLDSPRKISWISTTETEVLWISVEGVNWQN